MPSSDPITIPKVLKLVSELKPTSILDVGCGNGRYGYLFREILDMNHGRFKRQSWKTRIDAVEAEPTYFSPVHDFIYDNITVGDWMDMDVTVPYDLVFMGDVLEHFVEWQKALMKAKRYGLTTIVVAPNWKGSEEAQGAWRGHEYEAHRVELTPAMVGGRCLFANSKCFISAFGGGIIENWDILL